MGAMGLDLTMGSPLELIYNTQLDVMRDVDTAKDNMEEEVLGLEREKVNYTASAAAKDAEARYAASAGTIGVIGSAAQGIGKLIQPGGAWANIV